MSSENLPSSLGSTISIIQEMQATLSKNFDLKALQTESQNTSISDIGSAKAALTLALQARKLEKVLEESRTITTRPFLDAQKAINKIAKERKIQIELIEAELEKKISDWLNTENDNPFCDFKIDRLEVEDGSITIASTFDYKIENPNLIPREYLMVDEDAIKKAVKFGVRNIPGVKIIEKKESVLRVKN